eukprot:m.89939 g.89939  ORF g.89939 m.89939 type:complete len:642 (-) comp11790_c0_seq3:93-2018(-)
MEFSLNPHRRTCTEGYSFFCVDAVWLSLFLIAPQSCTMFSAAVLGAVAVCGCSAATRDIGEMAAAGVGEAPLDYDLVVYDATSGGVMAAVAAGRAGLKTALLCASWPACFPEGGQRVGGMSSGGLGQTDYGTHPEIIGGLALEFYTRNRQSYPPTPPQTDASAAVGSAADQHGDGATAGRDYACRLPTQPGCNATFNLEPSRALAIFETMLKEAGVEVFYSAQVTGVTKDGAQITGITVSNGSAPGIPFSAGVFVDSSYEGDLFARAGVNFTIGRESHTAYNESLAGLSAGSVSNQFRVAVNPFDENGSPLPLTRLPDHLEHVGDGDKKVPSYNFRLCVTQNQSNMVPFAKPAAFSPDTFELLRRYLKACTNHSCQLGFPSCNTQPVPGNKADMNNCGPVSSDFIGESWTYPNASYAERADIWRQHMDYLMGVMYVLSTDPNVPASIKSQQTLWGLCKDEFADNQLAPHWPPALYVREARRMQGPHIFTQNTPAEQKSTGSIGNLSIGLGGYNFDSHNTQRMACKSKEDCNGKGPGADPQVPYAWDEGDVQVGPGVFQIPATVLFPNPAEATNLLVVGAPSATHIGMSTLRMEPQFMILGHAAGAIAQEAIKSTDGQVQTVDMAAVRAILLAGHAKLDMMP